jgi:hypothetical protein
MQGGMHSRYHRPSYPGVGRSISRVAIAILAISAVLAGCAGIDTADPPSAEASSAVTLDPPPFPPPDVNPVLIPCLFRPAALTYQQDATGITVDNGKYRAHLSVWTGALDRVELKTGAALTLLLDDERFRVETPAGTFHESHLGGTRFVVPEATTSTGTTLYPNPHYLKVITESPVNGTSLFVRRVYEFTQGEHIYVQFELHATGQQIVQSWRWSFHNAAQSSAMFSSLGPTISFSYPGFDVADRTDPAHPVNAMKTNYRGYEVTVSDGATATSKWQRQSTQLVTLRTDQRIVGGMVLSVVPASPTHPPDFVSFPQRSYPIYAEYGLTPIAAATESVTDSSCRFSFNLAAGRPAGVPERFFNFADFNAYQILDLYAPVHQFAGAQGALAGRTRGALDHLLRGNMQLLERMANDGGYPQFGGWSRYACGTHYSTNSRGFSSAAYLWAYLTLGWDGRRWVSCTTTADPIYAQLQYTDRFFDPGNPWTFADELQLLGGHDYIAYATRYRENDPAVPEAEKIRAAIAAHSQGLHFVAMMRDAARLKGDTAASDAWRDRLVRFHSGTKAMFDRLHPGTDPTGTIRYPGLMNYAIGQEYIHNTGAYSQITYRGIIPGYLEAGEYELEHIEAIERMRFDWEATDAGIQGYPEHNIMWPLVRSNPLGLSFVYEPSPSPPDLAIFTGRAHGLRASYLESAVRLDDVLASGTGTAGGMHDPARYIRDSLGRHVLSNARVLTDWVPGAWEEVASAAVPADRRFTVTVPQIPADGSAGYWTAVQNGERIELMSSAATAIRPEITVDAVYGSARVQVRRHQPLSSTYPQHGTWGSVQTVASALLCVRSGDRCTFRLPSSFQLQRKDLLSFELARAPTTPTSLWTGPATGSPNYSLSWTGATGYITYYELQESRAASFTSPRTILVLGLFNSRLILNQSPGAYYYRIRATNDHGLASGYTTLVDATGAPAPIIVQ